MIYSTPPHDFKNKFEIVSCFCVTNGKLLFLHRQDHKPQGDLWGIPAGKVDGDENPIYAMQRELREETGIELSIEKLEYIDKIYTRYPEYDFTFYMYKATIDDNLIVILNPKEHKEFSWVRPDEASKLPLMEDIEECIKLYYK